MASIFLSCYYSWLSSLFLGYFKKFYLVAFFTLYCWKKRISFHTESTSEEGHRMNHHKCGVDNIKDINKGLNCQKKKFGILISLLKVINNRSALIFFLNEVFFIVFFLLSFFYWYWHKFFEGRPSGSAVSVSFIILWISWIFPFDDF